MNTPTNYNDKEVSPKEIIPSDVRIKQDTELLKTMREAFLACAEQCQYQIDFIAEYEEDDDKRCSLLPRIFSATLEKTLTKTENLLFTYQEHSALNPYDVWEYILTHQEPNCSNYGLNILDESITIHIPYLEMPHRTQGGNSLVERVLATLIRKNIDRLPNWYNWQAKFFLVFPASTKQFPRDVDNYDYKRIIDLIAFGLGSSDNAIHFAMSSETIFTDKITSGVFIEITPRSSENTVLPNWQKRGRGRPKGSKDKRKRRVSTPSKNGIKKLY